MARGPFLVLSGGRTAVARVELPLVLTALCLTTTSSDPGDPRPRTPEVALLARGVLRKQAGTVRPDLVGGLGRQAAGRLGAVMVRYAARVGTHLRPVARIARLPGGREQTAVLVGREPVIRVAHRPCRVTRGSWPAGMSVGETATGRGIGVRPAARVRRRGVSASNPGDGRQVAARRVRLEMTLIGVRAAPPRHRAIVAAGEDRRPARPARAVGVGGRGKATAVAPAGLPPLGAPLHRRATKGQATASGWVGSVGRPRRATGQRANARWVNGQRLTARIGSVGGLAPVVVASAVCRATEGGGTVLGPPTHSRAAKVLAAGPPDPMKIAPVRTVTVVDRPGRSRRIGPLQQGRARSVRSESAKVGGRVRVVTRSNAGSGRWVETNGRCARPRRRPRFSMRIGALPYPAHLASHGAQSVGNATLRPRPQPVRHLDRSDPRDPRLFRSCRLTPQSHPRRVETVLVGVVVVRRRR